jgi:spore coat protein U-like protein
LLRNRLRKFIWFRQFVAPRNTQKGERVPGWFDMAFMGQCLRICAGSAAAAAAIFLSWHFQQSVAAPLDTARVELTGTIPSMCAFTTLPATTTLGQLSTGAVTTLGSFGFTCNLGTSGNVQLTVLSANGALKRDGGAQTVAYEVHWNIQGNPVASGNPAAWTAPFGFTLSSGANGAEQLGAYAVRIVGPTDGLIAGEYKDTITYTISP